MKRLFLVFVVFLLILPLLNCASKKSEDVIYIGVAGPLTGSQAKMGNDILNAVKLAVKEWNERGGIAGRKIEIKTGDDEANENKAVSTAKQLANAGVIGVIGHFNSGCTIPASEAYKDAGVVMITPSATNPKVTDRKYWNVFRVCGRDDQQGDVQAEFAHKILKVKKVAILHDKTTYGQGLAIEFEKGIKQRGVEVVLMEGFGKEELDLRGVIHKVKSKEPDLWFFGGIYDQAGPLVNQAKQEGLEAIFMSGDGVIDSEFLKTAGKNAEGAYLTFSPDINKIPQAKEFIEKYKKEYGVPGPYSSYAYDAVNILLTAIKNTVDEKGDISKVTGKDIADRIRKTKHNGVVGTIEFDEKGDITASYYVMWIVKDGEFVMLEQED